MINNNAILDIAKKAISSEAQAIEKMAAFLDNNFTDAVECILRSEGRVIVSGIGKSAIIASKIVATLNSTGTPAIFMHAADAIHGDLGIVQQDDVVILISKSGNTPEIKMLLPLIKKGGNPVIGITAHKESALGKQADYTLDTYVEKEVCPHNLAPTTSTTAQMVMGDALAVCLVELRGFSSKDFAKYHPGGTLGKKLYLRVSDIAALNASPEVRPDAPVKDVIVEISQSMLGVTAVVENGELLGIVTDGDIRRMLNRHQDITALKASDIMTTGPKTIGSEILAVKALEEMQNNGISQLLVLDGKEYKGVVHLHNLIKEGIL